MLHVPAHVAIGHPVRQPHCDRGMRPERMRSGGRVGHEGEGRMRPGGMRLSARRVGVAIDRVAHPVDAIRAAPHDDLSQRRMRTADHHGTAHAG